MYQTGFVILLALTLGHLLSSAGFTSLNWSGMTALESSTHRSGHFCFQDKCRCVRDCADCSRNFGRLTFIPKLPKGIRALNFSYNNLVEIRQGSFFSNVTGLTVLDLSENNLVYISPDAFRLLSLQVLSLSYNKDLNDSALPAVFSITTLRKLDFRCANLQNVDDDMFYKHHLPYLTTLYLHGNQLTRVNLSAFTPLVKLQQLGLRENQIYRVDPGVLDNLDTLNLGTNRINRFLDTCRERTSDSLFRRLRRLYLDHNPILGVPDHVCLPKLQLLQLSHAHITTIQTDMFNASKFPNLIELYLESMNRQMNNIENYAFHNPVLQTVSLMRNDLEIDNFNPQCFSGCENLTNIMLSHNYLDSSDDKSWTTLLGHLHRLEYLYLDYAEMAYIPSVFSRLLSLRVLSLIGNRVLFIPDGAFAALTNLTILHLDGNQISVIKDTTFTAFNQHRLSHLDLSGNPFTCSCDVMWFRQWLLSDPKLFRHPHSAYSCMNLPGTNITSFYMAEQACLMSHGAYIYLAVTVAMLICTLTLVSLLFRYRWHFRLLLYEAFRGRGDTRRRRLQQQHFQYDVFVSYASDDLHWVRVHLMPELEGRLGLRLCIHERDFTPGRPIVDNIEESVQSSKKVLMVFSTHFAHSQWCQFELRLCLSHVMEQDDALLVVLLQDVPAHDMTSTMMAVLKTTTYIEWGEDPDARASFWGRMQIALTEIFPVARIW